MQWGLTIPDFAGASISAAENGRWRAVGRRRRELTRIEGTAGSAETARTDWTLEAPDEEYYVDDRVDDGRVGMATASRWSEPLLPWASAQWQSETSLLRLDGDRPKPVVQTRLSLDCLTPAVGVSGFVCIGFDGVWSRVWRFDSLANRLSPVAQIRGFIWGLSQSGEDRVIATIRNRQVELLLNTGMLDFLALDYDECSVSGHARAGDLVATVCTRDGETLVKLHRLGEAPAPNAP